MSDVHRPTSPHHHTHCLRVTFAYDAKTITLHHVRRVAMRAPAPATEIPGKGAVGYWLAVEHRDGGIAYHMPIHNPLKYDREVFHDSTGGHISRIDADQSSGTFEVLVPDLEDGAHLVLHGPRHGPRSKKRAMTARARRMVVHHLDELRRHALGEPAAPPAGGKAK